MQLLKTMLPAALIFFLAVPSSFAQDHEGVAHKFDALHHSADGYYMDFKPIGDLELPRIFIVRRADESLGLDIYGSTKAALRSFDYTAIGGGHEESPGSSEEHPAPEQTQELVHLSETEVEALIDSHAHLDAQLEPIEGHIILDMSISRHLVYAVIGALIVLFIFVTLARKYKKGIGRDTAPKGVFQNLFESLVLFVRDEIAKPNLGNKYEKFLPYLLSAFFFILTCNLMGLAPFSATATSNLMITAVLAVFTFLVTQFNGSKDHWKHVLWPPGVPIFVKPILIPVEILGLFTKPFALAIRLFANMTAGHLVVLSLLGLIFSFSTVFSPTTAYLVSPVSIAFSLFIYVLELLVAFIQAYIFTMLSALFIGMAVEEHHSHEEDQPAAIGQGSTNLLTENNTEELTSLEAPVAVAIS